MRVAIGSWLVACGWWLVLRATSHQPRL